MRYGSGALGCSRGCNELRAESLFLMGQVIQGSGVFLLFSAQLLLHSPGDQLRIGNYLGNGLASTPVSPIPAKRAGKVVGFGYFFIGGCDK